MTLKIKCDHHFYQIFPHIMQPYIKVSFIYIQFPVEMPTGKNNPM